MPKQKAKVIVLAINGVLKPRGFVQKKKTWYLTRAETIFLVDLQNRSGAIFIPLILACHCEHFLMT